MIDLLLWLLGITYVLVCAWLVIVVLAQEGKQGGMAGSETAAAPTALTDTFGAGGAQKQLFNWTAYAAAGFFIIAVLLTILGNRKERAGGNLDLGGVEDTAVQTDVRTITPDAGAGAAPGADTGAGAGAAPAAEATAPAGS